jgi:flagellin
MSVINTNTASLNAQRNLSSSSAGLATSLQRLSSGMRINSAKDDAAGLAISERMTTQIRGLNQAARNANDGISLAQTAEGALGEVSNNLQRIRELAVQSRNATNSDDDRAALQKEVSQLKSEIGRVAKDTQFNGINLLDGSFTSKSFQVGANQGQTIDIAKIANASLDSLGSWSEPTTYTQTQTPTFTDATSASSLTINGVTISTAANASGTAATAGAALKAAFDTAKNDPSNTSLANVSMSAAGAITSTDEKLTFSNATNITGLTAGATTGTATPGTAHTGFLDLNVSTAAGADKAILAMDGALKAVNSARADLGAVQNRFASVVSNVQTTTENVSASRSRIQDTDFASETANMTRNQILQQAGTAMLAQANQLPNGVMALLRG